MLTVLSSLAVVCVSGNLTTPPRFPVEDATAAQSAELDAAVRRFAAAELTLPELTARFSDDTADCDGFLGIFRSFTSPWTITICSDLAFVPIHELAHAWLEANVDTELQLLYLRAQHLERWNDKQDDRSERGVEHAAFIIQQNLMIVPATPLTIGWQRRADAYELLTGYTSPALDR
jgi:hypothetical protein